MIDKFVEAAKFEYKEGFELCDIFCNISDISIM